jgi:EAL domain-containing protein (putative c-di-GMP-specific phosphodiesterase class I)
LAKPIERDDLTDAARKAVAVRTLAKLRRKALESTGRGLQLGDHASLDARFDGALDRLWMAFQPIVRAPRGPVFGYEALVRSKEPSLPHPGALLDAAGRLDRLRDLGRRIRQRVAEAAPDAPTDSTLFVNVNSVDLLDDELYSRSGALTPLAGRIVLEMTERESLHRVPELATKVRALRELGFRLAVDDLGAGYAGLSSFTMLDPEIVKIDISLVRDIHLSKKKRSVVRGIAKVCRQELNTSVVCEGIEVARERDVLVEDGVELLQGYLFGKPEPGFADIAPESWHA